MIKYTIVIMILFYVAKGIGLEKATSEEEIMYHIISALLMLPIFGRILGWW